MGRLVMGRLVMGRLVKKIRNTLNKNKSVSSK